MMNLRWQSVYILIMIFGKGNFSEFKINAESDVETVTSYTVTSDLIKFASGSKVAEVQLVANEFNISSTLTFKQLSIDDPLIIHGRIIGLPPGVHRLFVHKIADISNQCEASGEIFNPTNEIQGGVGDLGNIEANQNGVAIVDITIPSGFSTLFGPNNLIDRTLVIHGNQILSALAGISELKLACGIIREKKPEAQVDSQSQYLSSLSAFISSVGGVEEALTSIKDYQYTYFNAAAGVIFDPNEEHIVGQVGLIQYSTTHPLIIVGQISGLTPGRHGFHVHEKGDTSSKCIASGGIFNPTNENHGGPNSKIRHAGDFGNIIANSNGLADVYIEIPSGSSLFGQNTLIGRTLVIHASEDTLDPATTYGNAGRRLACGIIADKTSEINISPTLISDDGNSDESENFQPTLISDDDNSPPIGLESENFQTSITTFDNITPNPKVAGVTIENQNRNIFGKVAFFQVTEKDSVRILGSLSGLSPGTHGLHIHEIGDISNNCASSGRINILGALGNIEADSSGNANIDIEVHDGKTSLFGANTVIGHTVVIHEGGETVGLRLACGIITDSTGFSSEAIQNSDLSVIVGLGAAVTLANIEAGIFGNVLMLQFSKYGPLRLFGEVRGLTPGLHGIHIHQNGDTSDNCAASAINRKVHQHQDGGKLENIQADSNGVSSFQLEIPSKISTLYGKNSIIGRILVIHNDDGKENDTKLVCGIIRKKDISTNSTDKIDQSTDNDQSNEESSSSNGSTTSIVTPTSPFIGTTFQYDFRSRMAGFEADISFKQEEDGLEMTCSVTTTDRETLTKFCEINPKVWLVQGYTDCDNLPSEVQAQLIAVLNSPNEFVTDVEIEKKIGLTHSDLEGNCLIILQDKDTNNGKRRSVISNNKNNWTKKLACIAERYIKRNNNEISDKKLFNSNCKPPPGAKAAEVTFGEDNFGQIGADSIVGKVSLIQFSETSPLIVVGGIFKLPPGRHGFHVHEFGDISNKCYKSGGIFNPTNEVHGGPNSSNRHAGDFGNIEANPFGFAKVLIEIPRGSSLFGTNTLIDRTLVIHADEDTLDPTTTFGNAGSRLACGIIKDMTSEFQNTHNPNISEEDSIIGEEYSEYSYYDEYSEYSEYTEYNDITDNNIHSDNNANINNANSQNTNINNANNDNQSENNNSNNEINNSNDNSNNNGDSNISNNNANQSENNDTNNEINNSNDNSSNSGSNSSNSSDNTNNDNTNHSEINNSNNANNNGGSNSSNNNENANNSENNTSNNEVNNSNDHSNNGGSGNNISNNIGNNGNNHHNNNNAINNNNNFISDNSGVNTNDDIGDSNDIGNNGIVDSSDNSGASGNFEDNTNNSNNVGNNEIGNSSNWQFGNPHDNGSNGDNSGSNDINNSGSNNNNNNINIDNANHSENNNSNNEINNSNDNASNNANNNGSSNSSNNNDNTNSSDNNISNNEINNSNDHSNNGGNIGNNDNGNNNTNDNDNNFIVGSNENGDSSDNDNAIDNSGIGNIEDSDSISVGNNENDNSNDNNIFVDNTEISNIGENNNDEFISVSGSNPGVGTISSENDLSNTNDEAIENNEIIVPISENNEISSSSSSTNFVGQCRSRRRQGKLLLKRWNPTVTRSFETISLGKFVVFSTATAVATAPVIASSGLVFAAPVSISTSTGGISVNLASSNAIPYDPWSIFPILPLPNSFIPALYILSGIIAIMLFFSALRGLSNAMTDFIGFLNNRMDDKLDNLTNFVHNGVNKLRRKNFPSSQSHPLHHTAYDNAADIIKYHEDYYNYYKSNYHTYSYSY